jgi:hypothetical protein
VEFSYNTYSGFCFYSVIFVSKLQKMNQPYGAYQEMFHCSVLSLLSADFNSVELLSQYVTEVYFLNTEYILTGLMCVCFFF